MVSIRIFCQDICRSRTIGDGGNQGKVFVLPQGIAMLAGPHASAGILLACMLTYGVAWKVSV